MRNKAELRSAVLDSLEAAQDPAALALVDLWIELAESDFAARLRPGWAIRTATDTWTTDTGNIPEDCVQILQLTGNGYVYEPVAPTQPDPPWPTWYRQNGESLTIYPAPTEAKPVTINVTYFLLDHIGDQDTDTSETLYHAPDCMLYGTLQHAAVFYGDDAGLARWTAALERAIANQNATAVDFIGGGGLVSRRR